MKIWDSIRNMWKQTEETVVAPFTETGTKAEAAQVLGFKEETEERCQEVYNHVTGVSENKVVKVPKSAINVAVAVLAFALCAPLAWSQQTCPGGTQPLLRGRNASDTLDQLLCYNPATSALSMPSGVPFTPSAITDGFVLVEPSNCIITAATTAFTAGPAVVRAAANNPVLQGTVNTTAGTITLDCSLQSTVSRATAGKGATITSIDIYYGLQTTALASIAAATPGAVTYPAAGGAAAGVVTNPGGSLTVTPSVLQLTTTASGSCFHENISFGTPYLYNSNVVSLNIEQVFTTTAGTATIFQVCGVGVNFSYQY